MTTLPAKLDYGLIDLDNYEATATAIAVRITRSMLEGVTMPCGYPGCSVCDPTYEWSDPWENTT